MEAFIGTIMLFAGDFAPRDWAFCHGQRLSIRQNEALYAILGKRYGSDGEFFNLPDLRGRMPLGAGAGPGLTPREAGDSGGDETVTLATAQLPTHTHALRASIQAADGGSPTDMVLATTADPVTLDGTNIYAAGPATVEMASSSVASAGGSKAHPNMPPYLAVNYIICLSGSYPSSN